MGKSLAPRDWLKIRKYFPHARSLCSLKTQRRKENHIVMLSFAVFGIVIPEEDNRTFRELLLCKVGESGLFIMTLAYVLQ